MGTTALFDRVIRDRKSHREALRQAMIDRVRRALKEMSESIHFKDAYLFGTITKPYRFFEKSDVDIAFIGLRDEDFFKAIAYLSRRLERNVDVVQLEKYRLREKVIKEGIPWTR